MGMASSDLDRFWLLAALQLDNEASAEELQELSQLLRDNPQWKDLLSQSRQASAISPAPLSIPDADRSFNRHMQRLSNHLSRQQDHRNQPDHPEAPPKAMGRTRIRRLVLFTGSIAASLVVVFFIARRPSKPLAATPNVISTRFGSKSRVQLPDGTEVWLNADSRLTYGKDFGSQTREVALSGEAFFDVQKDIDHPFIIRTGALEVRVLGTAFNIRSYQNEKTSEATLVRGAIEVTLNSSPDRKIVMRPSDRLVVQNAGNAKISSPAKEDTLYWVRKVDIKEDDKASLESVWKKNSLAFRNESLENVADRIEHWFNVKVDIQDEELRKMTYSCDFKDESLHQVMEALHLTGRFQYQIVKDSVIITK